MGPDKGRVGQTASVSVSADDQGSADAEASSEAGGGGGGSCALTARVRPGDSGSCSCERADLRARELGLPLARAALRGVLLPLEDSGPPAGIMSAV